MISTLAEAAELLDDAGHPALGIMFDNWHVWNTPYERGAAGASPIVSWASTSRDCREPTRGWARPGPPRATASATCRASSAALDAAGWTGPYDLEIFSDNGTFGDAYAGLALGGSGRRARAAGAGGVRTRAGQREANLLDPRDPYEV